MTPTPLGVAVLGAGNRSEAHLETLGRLAGPAELGRLAGLGERAVAEACETSGGGGR